MAHFKNKDSRLGLKKGDHKAQITSWADFGTPSPAVIEFSEEEETAIVFYLF